LYNSEDSYDYSEGIFCTVADKIPETTQQKYSSSGRLRMFGPREKVIAQIRKDIQGYLSNKENTWDIAVVNEFIAAEDDFYFRFSGPPDSLNNVYKLDPQTHQLKYDPEGEPCKNILEV